MDFSKLTDDDTEAIAFMAQLARVGCGKSHINDISKSPQTLTESIRGLLPPS